MPPPLQLGLGMGLPRSGSVLADLLNWDFSAGIPADFAALHSRASGATVVDSSGNVVWAPENIQLASQWDGLETRLTKTLNAAAGVEGDVTATYLQENTDSNSHYSRAYVATYRDAGWIGVRAKADASNRWLILSQYIVDGNRRAWFDLENGAVGTTGADVLDARIEDLGGGWYWCRVRYADRSLGAGAFDIGLADADAVLGYAGDGSSGIYIDGHQSMRSDCSFNETTGSAYYAPRLQHDKDGNPLGYLHEPQATNQIGDSTPDTNWITGNVSITENNAESPSGATDASLLTASGVFPRTFEIGSIAFSGTFSVFVKAGTLTTVELQVHNLTDSVVGAVIYNLSTGAVSSSPTAPDASGIEDFGNGWYRAWLSVTPTTTGAQSCRICPGDYSGAPQNGTIYAWGAQLETGTKPTSLIPTSGASATRQADNVAAPTIPDWSELGAFGAVFDASLEAVSQDYLIQYSGTSTNCRIWTHGGGANVRITYNAGGANEFEDLSYPRAGRWALAFDASTVRTAVNGTAIRDQSTTNPPAGDTNIGLFMTQAGIYRSVKLLNRLPSAAELATLTSP